jgi:hypothetical protein
MPLRDAVVYSQVRGAIGMAQAAYKSVICDGVPP